MSGRSYAGFGSKDLPTRTCWLVLKKGSTGPVLWKLGSVHNPRTEAVARLLSSDLRTSQRQRKKGSPMNRILDLQLLTTSVDEEELADWSTASVQCNNTKV